jgi:hypothetical protein
MLNYFLKIKKTGRKLNVTKAQKTRLTPRRDEP